MILHLATRYYLDREGVVVLQNNRLHNLFCDCNLYQFEPKGMKPTFRSVLETYGKKIYNDISRNLPSEIIIQKYKTDCLDNFGFKEEFVNYIFESILFGLRETHVTIHNLVVEDYSQIKCLENWNRVCPNVGVSKRCRFNAYYYHFLGFNITCIKGNSYCSDKELHSFKNPIDSNWQGFQNIHQTIDYIQSLNWDSATGIGLILGYNNLRALDIDHIFYFDEVNGFGIEHNKNIDGFVDKCLSLLGLPTNYPWVVRSGSAKGIHIIFKAQDIANFTPDVYAFESRYLKKTQDVARMYYGREKHEGFERVELRWNNHLVLPPSLSERCYNDDYIMGRCVQHFQYRFFRYELPTAPLSEVSIDGINNFLNYFCASDGERVDRYEFDFPLIGNPKITIDYGSWGVTEHPFKDSKEWLHQCKSPDALNSLGNLYALEKDYDNAAKFYRMSNNAHSCFNLANLIAYNLVVGTKSDAIRLYERAAKGAYANDYYIERLKNALDKME